MSRDGSLAGAGVLVSAGGSRLYVLTCAHVVTAAGGTAPGGPGRGAADVVVDLPGRGWSTKARLLRRSWAPPPPLGEPPPGQDLAGCGDFAALALPDDRPPLPPDCGPLPLAPCGTPDGQRVQIIGYPQGAPGGVVATGQLSGAGGPCPRWVQLDGVRTTGAAVERGFSGAAVWDPERRRVVGLITAAHTRQTSKTAWMLPVEAATRYWPPLGDWLEPARPDGADLHGRDQHGPDAAERHPRERYSPDPDPHGPDRHGADLHGPGGLHGRDQHGPDGADLHGRDPHAPDPYAPSPRAATASAAGPRASAAPLCQPPPPAAQFRLAEALLQVPQIEYDSGRGLRMALPAAVRRNVRNHDFPRQQVQALVAACLDHRDGCPALRAAVTELGGDTVSTHRALSVLDRMCCRAGPRGTGPGQRAAGAAETGALREARPDEDPPGGWWPATRPEPTGHRPGPTGHRPGPEGLPGPAVPKYLVDVVAAVDCLQDRTALRRLLHRFGVAPFERTADAAARELVGRLVEELCERPDGLVPLVEMLEVRDGNTPAVRRLKLAVAVRQVDLFDREQWDEVLGLLDEVRIGDLHRRYSEFLQDLGHRVAPRHCTEPWSVFLHAATLNSRPGDSLPCFRVLRDLLAAGAEGKYRRGIAEWAHANDPAVRQRFVPLTNADPDPAPHTRPDPAVHPASAGQGDPAVHPDPPAHPASAPHPAPHPDPAAHPRPDPHTESAPRAARTPKAPAPAPPPREVWRPEDYLIIRLRPLLDSEPGLDTLLSHWWRVHPGEQLRGSDRRIGLRQAEAEVRALLRNAESDWAYSVRAELALEFVLPRDLLDLCVERWGKAPFQGVEGLLGEDHQVVLRSLERINRRDLHRYWARRWDAFAGGRAGRVHWFPEDGRSHLLSDPPPAVVVLSGPPGGHRHRSVRSGQGERPELDELSEALRVGVPVILWDRRGERDPEFRRALRALLAEHDPRGLPHLVKALRTSADATDAEEYFSVGRHVALLWDDPERMPVAHTGSAAVPPPTPGEESP
ncbi:trypsin-like peptidase domain-containing protein [Streptomyces sp. NPDC004111]|uniref:VMAP-C domain-containing protein n=1 Tax=Streptomyces sp. NPDC004111 TaxID=3364690 RepID=UPI00367AE378